jgi:hypothetical protein
MKSLRPRLLLVIDAFSTDLGFTRDRLHLAPKSAKADLGGEPEVHPRVEPEGMLRRKTL